MGLQRLGGVVHGRHNVPVGGSVRTRDGRAEDVCRSLLGPRGTDSNGEEVFTAIAARIRRRGGCAREQEHVCRKEEFLPRHGR